MSTVRFRSQCGVEYPDRARIERHVASCESCTFYRDLTKQSAEEVRAVAAIKASAPKVSKVKPSKPSGRRPTHAVVTTAPPAGGEPAW